MLFSNREMLKEAIRQYVRKNRYNVELRRNDRKRVKAACKEECPWTLWVAKFNPKHLQDLTWQIKTYISQHMCLKAIKNRNMISNWMARHYLQKFVTDLNYSLTSLQQDVMADFVISASLTKCNGAKKRRLQIVFGNHKEQCFKIYDYLEELR